MVVKATFQDPRFVEAKRYLEKAVAYQQKGLLSEADKIYSRVVKKYPEYFDALHFYGVFQCRQGRQSEALRLLSKATKINPRSANALNSRGVVLAKLNRHVEALASFDSALALDPNLFFALGNRGNSLNELGRYPETIKSCERALQINPMYVEAYMPLGAALLETKRHREALLSYETALRYNPNLEEGWLGCGKVFREMERYDEAIAAYDRALALKPDLQGVEGDRLYSKMRICDWGAFEGECAHLISSVRDRKVKTSPFPFLIIPSTAEDQLECAKRYVQERPTFPQIWCSEVYSHDRIRVAYLSADFREHPVAYLTAGLFEHHDKSRFEITAISIWLDDTSELRERLRRSFDCFINAATLSDDEIAGQIKEREIDVLVDLNGFTQNSRTDILARRPAPLQINYLGYPGTMGASYIDYIIADRTIVPDECRRYYSEKIVLLPNTYQVNDRQRAISDKSFRRFDEGLPSNAFVFCCFNNSYKITPQIFGCWMRILTRVNGSVLWLLEDNPSAATNLKKEALARGVSPERLVFAKRMALREHLARHMLADLFLDTMPYNAHTTASDALWAGLPILTCLGETFAGRVAASLLHAIQLPELIATTLEAYEQAAVDLATNREKLTAIRRKLAEHRLTTPLFDTKLFARHIEAAYIAMHERYQAGLPPDHICVPR